MRIGFITPEFVTESNFSGGLGNYLYRLSKYLVKQGHEVHIIVLSESEQNSLLHDGIHVHRILAKPPPRIFRLRRSGPARHYYYFLSLAFKIYLRLARLHRKHPIDILQIPHMGGYGVFFLLFPKAPHVLRISGYGPFCYKHGDKKKEDLRQQISEKMQLFQFHLAKHVFAPSRLLKDILRTEENLENIKIISTPYYDEVTQKDYSLYRKLLDGKEFLLYVGRYEMLKGFLVLLNALPKVFEANPRITMVFVGRDVSSCFTESMESYAGKFLPQYGDRMIFIGQTPHAQLYPIIEKSRLVVLPSLIDNMPNIALEAMSQGKAVIGTKGASFDEFITDGVDGFLVPIGDSDALADKILETWDHPGLGKIGEAARRKVKDFAPERTVGELLAYYDEIIEQFKKTGPLRRLAGMLFRFFSALLRKKK